MQKFLGTFLATWQAAVLMGLLMLGVVVWCYQIPGYPVWSTLIFAGCAGWWLAIGAERAIYIPTIQTYKHMVAIQEAMIEEYRSHILYLEGEQPTAEKEMH